MANQAIDGGFDEHERPTTRTSSPDTNATLRIPAAQIEDIVRRESGARPVVRPEEIDRFVRDRAAVKGVGPAEDVRETTPAPPPSEQAAPVPAAAQHDPIAIDVDLSRISASSSQMKVDRRGVTVAIVLAIALLSALVGFLAGRSL